MEKIGIIYGPVKGNTEKVALKVAKAIGEEIVEVLPVKNITAEDIERFDKIIFGISTIGKDTWDLDHKNTDWDDFLPQLRKMDLSGKTIAMFGLGDNITYATLFVNALEVLATEVMNNGAEIIGQVGTDEYEFEDSKAVIDGKFIGLPINEDHESHLTNERVAKWVSDIKPKFGF